MSTKETFEEWCNYEKHHHNYSLFKEVWNHQQKKIDELEKEQVAHVNHLQDELGKVIEDLRERLEIDAEAYARRTNGLEEKIQDLEAKLALAVEGLRDAAEYIGNYGSEWKEEQLIKTLEELEEGERG